jgi:hypothetical protein
MCGSIRGIAPETGALVALANSGEIRALFNEDVT